MGLSILRFKEKNGAVSWGCQGAAGIHRLATNAYALHSLLAEDLPALARAALAGPALHIDNESLLSPVTAPCQIVCQGKNYLDHLLETGTKPANKDFNLLFAKADSSLAPPSGTLKRPPGVRLLDYEVELGL